MRWLVPTSCLSVLIVLGLSCVALTAGYVLAQQTAKVEWMGWAVVGKPHSSPDPGIYVKNHPSTGLYARILK